MTANKLVWEVVHGADALIIVTEWFRTAIRTSPP
jgi:hypothetical protein